MSAKLYFFHGTMASSKTAVMLMKAYSFEERGIPFLCFKPSIDNRDGVDKIVSRIGISRECLTIAPDEDLNKTMFEIFYNLKLNKCDFPKWLFIDECQFLSREQVNALAKVVDTYDVNVMCFGLRTDFKTNLFEGSKRLMEIADNIEELKISCKCGKKAIFNARVDRYGNIVGEGEQILIGGDENYIPMCRKCYYDALNKIHVNN